MNSNTKKFIIHVVHNLFPLNEYSEGELRNLMAKFKEEADDLNIQITDDQLKSYINRFDQLKNSPKITEKDLRKYSLSQLIKLVSKSAGADAPEEVDITPDVVYNNDNNTIVIYNGSKEGNCINFGQGEKWCITRGSYGNYRYSADRGYPTFYLAKNTNLPSDNPLSFVAIQVRDVPSESKRYVFTNRKNSPYESDPMDFNSLVGQVPWLSEVPNLNNILKYIPLSSSEKVTQAYKNKAATYREWSQFPFEMKKQYLVVRQNYRDLFDDIGNDEFVSKYLPEYPQLAGFIAINSDIIENEILLKNLDKFSNQDRKSIMANMRNKINLDYLKKEIFSFDVKKLLVKLDKWELRDNERMYVTANGEAIVLLTFGEDLQVGVYTADADYPNIKLNKRTSRFLIDYPDIDTIPFKTIIKLASQEAIDKSVINRVLEKAKNDPDSAIVLKNTEDGQILIDSNSFTSYKIVDDKITPIPFDSEEVQRLFNEESENDGFQNNVLQLLSTGIPDSVDKETFIRLIKNIPINNRIVEFNGVSHVVIITDEGMYVIKNEKLEDNLRSGAYFNLDDNDWRRNRGSVNFADDVQAIREYFEYARGKGWVYNNDEIIRVLNNSGWQSQNKKNIIAANPPLGERWMAVVVEDKYILLNRINPRNSKIVSSNTGRLINYNFPPRAAAQFIGTQATTVNAPGQEPGQERVFAPIRRRGRPARGEAPRQAPAAAAAVNPEVATRIEQFGLTGGFNSLPQNVRNTLSTGEILGRYASDRGASRRNNILRPYGGRVESTISAGNSKFYFIRLRNGSYVGSAVFQPGNQHYIVTPNASYRIPSPDDLVTQLRQRGLTENAKVMLALHAEADPESMNKLKHKLKNRA